MKIPFEIKPPLWIALVTYCDLIILLKMIRIFTRPFTKLISVCCKNTEEPVFELKEAQCPWGDTKIVYKHMAENYGTTSTGWIFSFWPRVCYYGLMSFLAPSAFSQFSFL